MRFFLLRCAPFRGIHLYVLSQVTSYLYLHSYLYYYLYRCALICIYLSSSLSLSLSVSLSRARAHTHTHTHTNSRAHINIQIYIRAPSHHTHTHRCAAGTFSPISGANSSTLCQQCTPSSTSPLASTSASDCFCLPGCCISLYMYTDMHAVFIHTMCMYTLLVCVCTLCSRGRLGEVGY
jgi:hypothetical protein